MSTTSKLAQDVARGVYANDAEFFQRDFDAAIRDAIHTAVSGSRVMFSAPNSQLAAPDDTSCPKCGGTKPTCCSCPATVPQPAPDAEGEWEEWEVGLDHRFVYTATGSAVAMTYKDGLAANIVSDHALAASVPKLVKALNRMLTTFSPFASADTERYREEHEAYEEALDAVYPSRQLHR